MRNATDRARHEALTNLQNADNERLARLMIDGQGDSAKANWIRRDIRNRNRKLARLSERLSGRA